VRSRLYLRRITDDAGVEGDPDARILKTMKSQYGRTGGEIRLQWRAGAFVATEQSQSAQANPLERAERVFLKLLDEFTAQDRPVKSANASGYAPKLFAASGRAEGGTKPQLHAAMESLFASGKIAEVFGGSGPPSRQTKRIVRADGPPPEPY
jgi:hypothetical protein